MPEPLSIALVSPHAWPARDDLARHVEAQARALAARGHRVTVLAPGVGRDLLADGRARLRALEGGDPTPLLGRPGRPLVVAIGRGLPTGSGRRLAGPFDLSANLEAVLARAPYDVVHLHEPLAPSPALPTLRHAPGVTAATFHRTEQLAGVAFLRPLVDRALARVDLRMAATETARRALAELLPGDYLLVRAGVDTERFAPAGARARRAAGPGRHRPRPGAGRRAVRAARPALGGRGAAGPGHRPGRRGGAVAHPGGRPQGPARGGQRGGRRRPRGARTGPRSRTDRSGGDAGGRRRQRAGRGHGMRHGGHRPALRRPRGRAHPRARGPGPAALQPGGLVRGRPRPGRRRRASRRARRRRGRARTRPRSWAAVAAELEDHYRLRPRARGARPSRPSGSWPTCGCARLRRPTPRPSSPPAWPAGWGPWSSPPPAGIEPALAVAASAPPDLTVVVGQEIATGEGTVVGLFLRDAVEDGLGLPETLERVHAQGALVMVPSPAAADAPAAELLRRHAEAVDCYEVRERPGGRRRGDEAAALIQRLGLPATAGSAAAGPDEVG